jgi:hypothetical protein
MAADQPALGGQVDPGMLRLAAIYRDLPFHSTCTTTRAKDEAAWVVCLA